MFNVLIRTIAIDLIFIIVALCIALIVVLVRHRKHEQDDSDVGVCVPNNKGIIDRYDILAVLVGCVIGFILNAAMEAGI